MGKPSYTYSIVEQYGRNVIRIVDKNGTVSVTNAIETVVTEIGKKESINPNQYMIVYCDSCGDWDGWDNKRQQFVLLGKKDCRDAVKAYIDLQHNGEAY